MEGKIKRGSTSKFTITANDGTVQEFHAKESVELFTSE